MLFSSAELKSAKQKKKKKNMDEGIFKLSKTIQWFNYSVVRNKENLDFQLS